MQYMGAIPAAVSSAYMGAIPAAVRCKEHLLPVMAIKNNSILGWYALSMHQSHQRL